MRAVWQLHPALEDVVYAQAQLAVPALVNVASSTSAMLAAIEDRSRRYTSERLSLAKPTDPTADIASRALFFTVVDAPKVQIPLQELLQRAQLNLHGEAPLRVVDLGAGCGAMSLGLLDFWAKHRASRPLQLELVERDVAALRIAKTVLSASAQLLGLRCEISVSAMDLSEATLRRYDLALAGTVFNELPVEQHLSVAQQMLRAVAPAGHAIIIEPALRTTSRDLHRLRDSLLSQGHARVMAPCTKSDAPCPALHKEQDWCHEDRLTKLPPRTHELARITGLRDSGLKFSYLLLGHVSTTQLPATLVSEFRVMSSARSLKGQVQVAVCGSAGWQTVRLLRRHRNSSNQELLDSMRGDVIQLHDDLRVWSNPRIDVTADTAVHCSALPQVGTTDVELATKLRLF
jgi:ribosomal protein RSM22 (predicted rRNA methylase)